MNRTIVYPGAIPLDTDLLATNRNTMLALGALIQAVLGTGTVVDGLAVGPTAPASMSINVGPGSITGFSTLDAAAYGSLLPDATPLVKMGVNSAPTSFTLAAPTSSGQATNWLIEATFLEADDTPVVLPYYNAANPAQPYLGPANGGGAQNTRRAQLVQLQAKPGAPAASGSQTTPAVDAGWVGLAVVTLAYGQTSITASSIAPLAAAPVLGWKLPQLRPGFSAEQAFTGSGNFIVPAGVVAVRVRLVGAGGGGAGTSGSTGGGSGGAGGYGEGIYAVTPGQSIGIGVGAAGAGGASGNNNGANGGASYFGSFLQAGGGGGGTNNGTLWSGGSGGSATGGAINVAGSYGSDGGSDASTINGVGGASLFGGAGRAFKGATTPGNAQGYGSGGGGAYGSASAGGNGAPGLVVVEW